MSSVTFSTTVGGDGSTVTDDDDATTGLRNGGWRTRFVPALAQEVAVAANAVASATAALSSKNAAAASATTATTQASTASTSATNAANSATAAAASYDSFDDRYLGVKTSDPTVDNDGNALLVGALYWNSATSVFKVWSGSVWITNLTSNQFGTNVATFLQTPSSANLATALTDEIGTAGKVVFDTNPTFPAQINLTANSGYNIYATGTAPNYMAGDLNMGATLTTGVGVSTGWAAFELGGSRTGNGASYIDFHSTVGTDYDCRILRDSGANGALQIVNTGTGDFQLQASGAAPMTFLTNATERIRIESSGNVGIGGTPSADAKFEISGTYPSSGTVSRVIRTTGTIPSTTTGTARMFGSEVNTQAAAFNISSLQHFSAIVNSIGAGSTISNQFGVLVDGSLTDAVNNFGFYGGINASAGTTRYNLYMAGTADNYLAGTLNIGGSPAIGQNFRLAKTLTGATSTYSFVNQATIATDSTTGSTFNYTGISTAAAASIGSIVGYNIGIDSLGAGSSIGTMIGYGTGAFTSAATNYGFYGAIPYSAGKTNYNLYMAGTAPNYMAGDLTIGSTLITGVGVSTGGAGFELGANRTGNGPAYIDFHSTVGTDYDCRILRDSGANGVLHIVNTGTGDFQLQASGAAPMTFFTNATERIRIHESSGNVGIGTSSPDASAILDAQSTTKGVRFPNMTTTQKNAISSPAAGLVVFDTTSSKLSVYTGAAWQTITSA